MKKITLKLSNHYWEQLYSYVKYQRDKINVRTDKYTKAIIVNLLDQVILKLHSKFLTLKPAGNRLNHTFPEAAVLAIALLVTLNVCAVGE